MFVQKKVCETQPKSTLVIVSKSQVFGTWRGFLHSVVFSHYDSCFVFWGIISVFRLTDRDHFHRSSNTLNKHTFAESSLNVRAQRCPKVFGGCLGCLCTVLGMGWSVGPKTENFGQHMVFLTRASDFDFFDKVWDFRRQRRKQSETTAQHAPDLRLWDIVADEKLKDKNKIKMRNIKKNKMQKIQN